MRLFKFFSFWLGLFALSICAVNMAGHDDKNLLLSLTSPILMLLEGYSAFFRRFISDQVLMWTYYLLNVLFWCYAGLIIDTIVHSARRKKFIAYLARIGAVAVVVALAFVLFYTYQNSEKKIGHIIQHPDEYNEQSIQVAVMKAAEEGYGHKYVNEMELILYSTSSNDIYGSTVHALGIIGTPSSIKAIVEYHKDRKEIIIYSLQRNENTIISMLDVEQPKNIVNAGIQAAKWLEFGSFIQPLRNLANNYPDKEIRKEASAVMQQISKNPKENNPKFNVD